MKIIVRCWYSIMPKLDPNPVVKEGGLDWSMARLTNSIHVKPIRLCRNDIFGKHRQKRERMSSVRLSTSTPPNIKPLIRPESAWGHLQSASGDMAWLR